MTYPHDFANVPSGPCLPWFDKHADNRPMQGCQTREEALRQWRAQSIRERFAFDHLRGLERFL